MNINGKPADYINFFPGIDLNDIQDDVPEKVTDRKEISRLLKESNISSGIPLRFANSRFDDNPVDFTEELREFSLNPKDRVIVLSSGVGCGKTTLLCSAIHERALNGMSSGTYFSNLTLDATLRTCRSFTAKESELSLYERLGSTSFLVIDEFGASQNITDEARFVSTILRLRYDNELPTMIATNYSPSFFKLALCGINTSGISLDKAKEMVANLVDPTIDRLRAVMKGFLINDKSHR